jgi:hypothetical protein
VAFIWTKDTFVVPKTPKEAGLYAPFLSKKIYVFRVTFTVVDLALFSKF